MDKLISNLETLINQTNQNFSREAWIAFLGGFSGAFFAFLFERLSSEQDKRRTRYKRHHDALVRVEYTIVKQQDNISRLVYSLESSVQKLRQNPPVMPAHRFPKLKILEDIELDLGDINLINEVSDYWLTIERINTDTETINRLLDSLNTALLSGINVAVKNFEHLAENMEGLASFLKNIALDENISLNAYIVLLLERESDRTAFKKALQGYRIIEHEIAIADREKKKQEIYAQIKQKETTDSERLARNLQV